MLSIAKPQWPMQCQVFWTRTVWVEGKQQTLTFSPLTGGGAKDFQCIKFLFQSELSAGLFFVILSRFLDGGLLAGIFFSKIFSCRNFISGIVAPHPAISNGPPLILAVQGYEFYLLVP